MTACVPDSRGSDAVPADDNHLLEGQRGVALPGSQSAAAQARQQHGVLKRCHRGQALRGAPVPDRGSLEWNRRRGRTFTDPVEVGKLLKHEYVRMQEVARTADHAPSRTSYLWKVDLPSVLSKIDLEIETATDNLNMRLSYEELGMRPCQYLSSSYKHAGDIIPFGGSTPAQTGRSTALLELGIFRLGETHLAFYS